MLTTSLLNQLAHIQLLVLDVDGVLTNGKVCLLPNGEEIKFFHIHDGYGLQQLQKAGIIIAIITGRVSAATTARMSELSIQHVFQGSTDKLNVLNRLCEELNISLQHVAYVGDDIPDYAAMCACGIKLSVANAVPDIKRIADYCTRLKGGKGAVREICDLLLAAKNSQATAQQSFLI